MLKRSMRILSAILLLSGAALGRQNQKKKTPAKPADPPAACSSCKEKKPVLDPASLDEKDRESRPAYAAAQKYPALIDSIHCYCGCEQNPSLKHASLLTCFTSLHATGCEICQAEANLAAKMKGEGSSDEEIKAVVESLYQARQ